MTKAVSVHIPGERSVWHTVQLQLFTPVSGGHFMACLHGICIQSFQLPQIFVLQVTLFFVTFMTSIFLGAGSNGDMWKYWSDEVKQQQQQQQQQQEEEEEEEPSGSQAPTAAKL